jgi:transcription-repair coupling factor (superfamily II helicase)
MPLRSFLTHIDHDPTASRLADEGGSAFVSQSLRAYLIAAVADRDVRRPAVIVAGDDRSARDLAADLRAWLKPRPVRFYPSRGVAYESHLTPPPHLVGLRVAALDALLDTPPGSEQPVVVISAVALSEKVPDPKLRPHGFVLRVGDLLDLDEAARDLVAAGYERVDQVEDRGQFAVRGGLLDVYPATEERAVRVDLFDDEIESLRWFSTFTQRSLGEAEAVEIAPAAELAAEHRELAEIAALEKPEERPDVAELLPVGDFRELLDLVPEHAHVVVAADEDVEPALRDHWDDVTAAFHDTDAHHLYVAPDGILAALGERAAVRLSSISGSQPVEIRAQAADFAARSLREAEPEMEKLVRSGYTTVVTWPQRGAAERAAYNLGRAKASFEEGNALVFVESSLRDGFIAPQLKLAAVPEHRLIHRRRSVRRRRSAAAACCAPSRTCARGTSWCTRTTASPASPASTPRRSPTSRGTTSTWSSPARTRCSCRSTSWRRSPATSGRTARTRRCPSWAARAGRR